MSTLPQTGSKGNYKNNNNILLMCYITCHNGPFLL
ncbi:unnamed protein product, partial [Vitis vinifera]|uniref:Uncharacterized protein n=1 Tax=Vitis vinifera TaxID=29760 RepID=E0CPZ2_VITVI